MGQRRENKIKIESILTQVNMKAQCSIWALLTQCLLGHVAYLRPALEEEEVLKSRPLLQL